MSFSFRNIFNPEDGESEGVSSQAGGDMRHQASFSSSEGGGGKSIRSQTFQVSELLPFIPPAIAALTGIPMAKEVEIPLSADGSNDVLLSTIYEVCPELFAAEITPLNESTVTLPAKLNPVPEPASEGKSPFSPGAAFSKPPGMAASSTPAKQSPSPRLPASENSNPFWSPEESATAPESKKQPLNDMSEPHSQQRIPPSSSGSQPPQGLGESEIPQGKSSSSTPFSAGNVEPEAPAPREDVVAKGFSAPSPAGGNLFEQKGEPKKEKSPEVEPPSPDSQFSGNPFESEGGYSTLFSAQAEEDAEIPFPSPSSQSAAHEKATPQQEKAPEGTWGTMFDAKANSMSDTDSVDMGKGFESIGNLIPKSLETPATPTPAGGSAFGSADVKKDDDYGDLLPPLNEAHELPDVLKGETDPSVEPEEQSPVSEEAMRPSFGFEPAAQSIPQGFSKLNDEPGAAVPTAPVSDLTPDPAFAAPEDSDPTAETPVVPVSDAPPADEPSERAQGSAFSSHPAPAPVPVLQPLQPEAPTKSEPQPAPEPVATPKPEIALEAERVVAPDPVAPPAATASVPNVAIPGSSASGEIKDLELRAIFSTNDPFTLRSVARRVVALPGISSCALATPGRLVQASRNEESRIGDEAKEMVQTIRNLAKLTGLPDAQSFTLHTDKGIVSLFLDGECCLTVHHEAVEFEPGTREKLILVSRNLENLEK